MNHRKDRVRRILLFEFFNIKFFLESPTQVGDDYSFDEPFMMRSSDGN
jgi:hypothetical protein